MVKILQAYNFAKQQTYALNGDILAATLIGNNRIAISSAEQFIEIYDIAGKQQSLSEPQEYVPQEEQSAAGAAGDAAAPPQAVDERMPARYTLATVGEVVQLIYCEAGEFNSKHVKSHISNTPLMQENICLHWKRNRLAVRFTRIAPALAARRAAIATLFALMMIPRCLCASMPTFGSFPMQSLTSCPLQYGLPR